MTTAPALRLTLTGVAELARVRRPVVSMWRTRFAGGTKQPAAIKLVMDQMEAMAPRYAAER